jgi:dATP pyrophosphohydrolase
MFKIPVSVLVVIHTPDMQVLLLERADHPGWWQSVTGSQNPGETYLQTAIREVHEETGLNVEGFPLIDTGHENRYEIFDCYRHRYEPGTTHNTEHVFTLELPRIMAITLASEEHVHYQWAPASEAARQCFSPSNAEAIQRLASGSNPR